MKYIRVLNSRGLTLREKIIDKDPLFIDEESTIVDSIISSLYADLQSSYPNKLKLTNLESKDIPEGYYCSFFIVSYDLFVIFSGKPILKEEVDNNPVINKISKERNLERNTFKGVVVADFDDVMGPVPIFNTADLTESELAILAVQGTTVLGMSMENMPNHTVGPVPIPANPKLSCLIRGFQRPAPNSEDPRIQLGGRPATIFIVLDSSIKLDKESSTFIDAFFGQWIVSDAVQEVFDDQDLTQMSIDLEQVFVLAQDLVKVRDVQVNKLRELLKWSSTENLILRQEIKHLQNEVSEYKLAESDKLEPKKPAKKKVGKKKSKKKKA